MLLTPEFKKAKEESGGNTYNAYIKFKDGTMICYGSVTCPASQNYIGKEFPLAFTDIPMICLTNNYNNSQKIIASVGSTTNSKFDVYPIDIVTNNCPTVSSVIRYIAIGKWK